MSGNTPKLKNMYEKNITYINHVLFDGLAYFSIKLAAKPNTTPDIARIIKRGLLFRMKFIFFYT